jgi:hypothetical protein
MPGMRKDLFNELVASVKEMKAIQAGRLKPARVTPVDAFQTHCVTSRSARRARAQFAHPCAPERGSRSAQ